MVKKDGVVVERSYEQSGALSRTDGEVIAVGGRPNHRPMIFTYLRTGNVNMQTADEHIEPWISVKTELPTIPHDHRYHQLYVRVLAAMDNGNVREMGFVKNREEKDGRWLGVDGRPPIDKVTHWMPLPEHPKKSPAATEQGGRS